MSGTAQTLAANTGQIYVAETNQILSVTDMGEVGSITLGTFGTGVGEFSTLEGIFVDRMGRIYVTDFNKIVRINHMTGAGWTVLRGAADNTLSRPSGIFVDGADRIYVTDRDSGSIVRVNDMTGAGWTTLGSRGSGVSQFNGVAMQSTP